MKKLVLLATYNEIFNVRQIYILLRKILGEADILFVDDNSPDGTGREIDNIVAEDPNVAVIHRPKRLGVGSAHKTGIIYAIKHDYEVLVTMDCDMAHSPDVLPRFIEELSDCDLVIGSRFKLDDSLPGWSAYRKALTHFGHRLTRLLLEIPYDATGALRCYRLASLPKDFPDSVKSNGYPFFFESMHVMHLSGMTIKELPVCLPARTYGESKMRISDVFGGFFHLFNVAWRARFSARAHKNSRIDSYSKSSAWDDYWFAKASKTGHKSINQFYEIIAGFYRTKIIKPALDIHLRKTFPDGVLLLHAGCGSGMVDQSIAEDYQLIACDFSKAAQDCYREAIGKKAVIVGANLFNLPFRDQSFDGLYNLGVMEHFTKTEITVVLHEIRRVLLPHGKVVLFWPHVMSPAVITLKLLHLILNRILFQNIQLHPPEPTLIGSREQAEEILAQGGFSLIEYTFNQQDAFTHAVIIAEPREISV